jgi:hypothetical protein
MSTVAPSEVHCLGANDFELSGVYFGERSLTRVRHVQAFSARRHRQRRRRLRRLCEGWGQIDAMCPLLVQAEYVDERVRGSVTPERVERVKASAVGAHRLDARRASHGFLKLGVHGVDILNFAGV